MENIYFIVWSKISQRTKNLSAVLNAKLLHIGDKFPYLKARFISKKFLNNIKNEKVILILQLPPGPALSFFSKIKSDNICLVLDTHTGFLYHTSLKELFLNKPYLKEMKSVDLIVVHNHALKAFLTESHLVDKDKILVVYDPIPLTRPLSSRSIIDFHAKNKAFNIVVPSSWSSDEPLDHLVRVFKSNVDSSRLNMFITGDPRSNPRLAKKLFKTIKETQSSSRVFITGFLSRPDYLRLLHDTDVVIALSNREYTFTSAMWEAVAFRKPFVVLETYTVKKIIRGYPCIAKDISSVIDKALECSKLKLHYYFNYLEKLSNYSVKILKSRIENLC